jgi:hypothetical protein
MVCLRKAMSVGVDFALWLMDIPLSQLSTAASNSLLASMRSASLFIRMPLSVPGSSFHDGWINAALAACTAMSTSFAEPAWTSAMTDSVLVMDSADKFLRRNNMAMLTQDQPKLWSCHSKMARLRR